MDEILVNKKTSIERCVKRIQEDFDEDFLTNYTKQDAVILNIERACQAAIDMGNHVLKVNNFGLPQSNRDTFLKLEKNRIISIELSRKMQAMTGFRNLAVHDYSSVNIEVVIDIVKNRLQDITDFSNTLIGQF